MYLEMHRAAYFAPWTNRTTGPKLYMAMGPTKNRPGTELSKLEDKTGAESLIRISERKCYVTKGSRDRTIL